jgi:hypothetical protein
MELEGKARRALLMYQVKYCLESGSLAAFNLRSLVGKLAEAGDVSPLLALGLLAAQANHAFVKFEMVKYVCIFFKNVSYKLRIEFFFFKQKYIRLPVCKVNTFSLSARGVGG